MVSSCEFGIEPTGSMKCWETIEWLTSSGLSSSAQLHIVSYIVGKYLSDSIPLQNGIQQGDALSALLFCLL
jgi:hypothetical protein